VLESLVEDQGTDPVAAPSEQDRCGNHELAGGLPLEAAGGAPIEGAAGVEDEPGVEAAVGVGLADVGPVGAGGQVPVDLAGIVARHVLADVGLLHPGTAPAGAVVAGRVHAERAEHRPVEAAETVADVRLSGGHFLQAP